MNKPHGSAIGDWLRACASLHVQEPEAYAQVARLLGLDIALPQVEKKPVPVRPVTEPIAPAVPQPVEETVIETAPAPIAPTPAITYLQPIRTERPSEKDLRTPFLTLKSSKGLNQAVFLPGGRILTSSDLVVWDEATGIRRSEIKSNYGKAKRIAVVSTVDRNLIAIAVEFGCLLMEVNGRKIRQLYVEKISGVEDICFDTDGKSLIYVHRTGEAKRHNLGGMLPSGTILRYSGLRFVSVAVGRFEDQILTIAGSETGIWCSSRNLEQVLVSYFHQKAVRSVCFHPEWSLFATGGVDQLIYLWKPPGDSFVFRLDGHTGAIASLAFHPAQPYLASGSADATIRLWHTATGQCQLTLSPGRSPITSVAWNADGSRLLASSWDGQVHLWDFAVLQALMADKTQTAAPVSPSGGSESPATDPPPRPRPRPRLQPLFQPEWQAGLIHGLASARQMGQALDLPRLVDQAARLQPFHVLPRRHDFRGGSRVQLLIDRDDQMMAFLQDSKELEKECRRLLGKEALDIQRFHGDPTEGAGPGPIWDWSPYHPPAPGTHIVLVSNLGAMPWHEGFESPRWRRFARRVADAGCPLTCLSPLRPTRYSPGLVRALRIVFWDRRTQLAHIHRLAHP